MLKEFKDFISKGNVLDLAVAVIMATAFGAIVKSLVANIIMPIVGALMAGMDFEKFTVKVLGVELGVGIFVSTIINFIIVAFVMFLIIKAFNKAKKKEEEKPAPAPTTKECGFCFSQIHLDATRCANCTSQLN